MTHDDADEQALELIARAQRDGVAVASVTDGSIFILSRRKLEEMIQTIDESKDDKIIMFVKHEKLEPIGEKIVN